MKDPVTRNLDIDFINLDKRNYIKVLSQMTELPKFIYIWYDEEKISDYIKENYPSIEVLHFDAKNAIRKNYDSYYSYYTKEYKLADLIIKNLKDNLEKVTMYKVDEAFKIKKIEMDDLEIAASSHVFKTQEEAESYCISTLEDINESLDSSIKNYERFIKDYKKELARNIKLLAKYYDKRNEKEEEIER